MGKKNDAPCYVGVRALGSTNIDHMTLLWMGHELPPITIMGVLKKFRDYKSRENRKSIETWDGLLVTTIDLKEDSWVRKVRNEMLELGAKDHSEFEWNPHVTLGVRDEFKNSVAVHIPPTVTLQDPYISINGVRIYG